MWAPFEREAPFYVTTPSTATRSPSPCEQGEASFGRGAVHRTLLIFKLLQLVSTFLLRLVFTGDADGVFLLIKRVDFVCHKVGDAFFFESDGADDAVFLLNTEKGFFHAEGGDGAGEAPDLAGLLAALYVVLEGFGDGGGVFVGNGEGAATGVACPGDIQRKIVLVHVLVEGLHGLHHYHQPGGRSRPGSSECT